MKIVAFGNPLLDTIVLIQDNSLLKKYELDADGQKEISQNEMKKLMIDIGNYKKTVTAGGCAQNTLRIFQWVFPEPCSAVMYGAVGDDTEGSILKDILKTHNVETHYKINDRYSTGSSVALVSAESRSLVAHLGAAEIIGLEDLKSDLQMIEHLRSSVLVYVEGFFITNGRAEVAFFIVDFCKSVNKTVAFYLSGQYLCKEYPEQVKYLMHNSDVIFGNKKEFLSLCTIFGEDINTFLRKLGEQGKIVIMTNGSAPVTYVQDKLFGEMAIPSVNKEDIIDTTGAGDSFVAGFLAGYLLQKPLQKCIEVGCYAAREIIKQRGCTLPDYNATIFEE